MIYLGKILRFWGILIIFGVNLFFATFCSADTYKIDPAHTAIGFAVKHLTISTVKGNFTDFEGTIDFDAAKPENFKADVTIQVNSINTNVADRDKHLKTADFFDVEKFPIITFTSSKLEKTDAGYSMNGSLTIKGVTKTVIIPVTMNGPVPNPFGGTAIGISGHTTINRQDFGVTWNKTMDNGGVVVDDNVDISVEIEADKK